MYFKGFKTKVNFCNRKRASLVCAFAAVFYLAESTVLWAAEEAAEGAAQAKLDPLAWKSDLPSAPVSYKVCASSSSSR